MAAGLSKIAFLVLEFVKVSIRLPKFKVRSEEDEKK